MAERQRSRTTQWTLRALLLAAALMVAIAIHPHQTSRPEHPSAAPAAGGCSGDHDPDAIPAGMRPPCADGQHLLPAVLTRGTYTPRTVPCRIRGTELPAHSRPAPHIQPRPA